MSPAERRRANTFERDRAAANRTIAEAIHATRRKAVLVWMGAAQ